MHRPKPCQLLGFLETTLAMTRPLAPRLITLTNELLWTHTFMLQKHAHFAAFCVLFQQRSPHGL